MTDFIILLYVHFSHSHRAKRDPRHFCFAIYILPTVFRYHNNITVVSYRTVATVREYVYVRTYAGHGVTVQ